jgi:hypothetical protein
MNKSLSVVRTMTRSGIESRIAQIALALAAILPSLPALAERHEEGGHGHGGMERHEEGRHWDGDIARFHEHDLDRWRGGRWTHEDHDGRLGWWWVAGDAWYFYPAPVYPYPDPYAPPETIATAPSVAPPAAPAPRSWYYCEAVKSYYPYVQTCPGGWKALPVPPADSTPPLQ